MIDNSVSKELTYNKNIECHKNQMVFIGNWFEEKHLRENFDSKNSFQRTMIWDAQNKYDTEMEQYGSFNDQNKDKVKTLENLKSQKLDFFL